MATSRGYSIPSKSVSGSKRGTAALLAMMLDMELQLPYSSQELEVL
jgi:hypothetical protein